MHARSPKNRRILEKLDEMDEKLGIERDTIDFLLPSKGKSTRVGQNTKRGTKKQTTFGKMFRKRNIQNSKKVGDVDDNTATITEEDKAEKSEEKEYIPESSELESSEGDSEGSIESIDSEAWKIKGNKIQISNRMTSKRLSNRWRPRIKGIDVKIREFREKDREISALNALRVYRALNPKWPNLSALELVSI